MPSRGRRRPAAAQFSLAPPLAAKPEWAVEPAEFVMRLAGETGTLEDELKRRVEAIKKSGRGTVLNYADSKQTPAKEIEDLWKALAEGAVWMDDAPPEPAQPTFTAVDLERALASPPAAITRSWRCPPPGATARFRRWSRSCGWRATCARPPARRA